MTQISDIDVGYPRLYLSSEKPDMFTIFFAKDSPGYWIRRPDSAPGCLVSACVDREEGMLRRWPEEELVTDPVVARRYLEQLASCHIVHSHKVAVEKIDPEWRYSWRRVV